MQTACSVDYTNDINKALAELRLIFIKPYALGDRAHKLAHTDIAEPEASQQPHGRYVPPR